MAKMSAHGHATLCLIRKRQEPVANQLCTRIVKYRFMSDGKVLRLAQCIWPDGDKHDGTWKLFPLNGFKAEDVAAKLQEQGFIRDVSGSAYYAETKYQPTKDL